MSHRVTWVETNQSFEVPDGETVLTAALDAQVRLPYECTLGGCGSCRVKLVEGRVRYEEEPMALTPEEAEEGYALMCQGLPLEDLVISVEPPHFSSPPTRLQARIAGLQPLGPGVTHLELDLPDDHGLLCLPGQHVNLHFVDEQHRSFSLASPPSGNRIDFHIRTVAGGWFTDGVLRTLQPGQTLDVELPMGSFTYHAEDYRPLVMVATGTGLAPIKSILESLFDDGDCPPVSLYWGMRTLEDLYLHEQIARWGERLYEFQYVPVLSRPGAGWTGRTGHVQQAVVQDLPDLSEHALYLCGSPQMIVDAKTLFASHGADMAHVYADSFLFQSH